MKVPLRTRLSIAAFAVLMMLQYQNCSSYNDPSLFEMKTDSLTSVTGSTPTEVRLDSPLGALDVGQYDLALSMGGTCNIGLAKKHYIEIKLLDSSNAPVPVRIAPQDNTCPENGTNLPSQCYVAKQFQCEHGKYYVHLPISCRAYRNQAQSLYRVLGQLVTIDDQGVETRDNKASFNRFFQISWAPSACPL